MISTALAALALGHTFAVWDQPDRLLSPRMEIANRFVRVAEDIFVANRQFQNDYGMASSNHIPLGFVQRNFIVKVGDIARGKTANRSAVFIKNNGRSVLCLPKVLKETIARQEGGSPVILQGHSKTSVSGVPPFDFRPLLILGGVEINVSPKLLLVDRFGSDKLLVGRIGGSLGVVRGTFGEESRTGSGAKRKEAERGSPSGNPCLLDGDNGTCVAGVRRTSSRYEAVSGFLSLALAVSTGLCFGMAFSDRERVKSAWFAAAFGSLISGGVFTVATITGKVWLFGL